MTFMTPVFFINLFSLFLCNREFSILKEFLPCLFKNHHLTIIANELLNDIPHLLT